MSEFPLITIIMATFNSSKTLPMVLESIRAQDYPADRVEVLLVDGGSTDQTLTIGKSFGATIINNPRTEPVYAKYLGYKAAQGKYGVYLDHDEVIERKDSLSVKVSALRKFSEARAVIGSGYKCPPDYPFINQYINEFGDPFSYFVYNLSKDSAFFVPTLRKRYGVKHEDASTLVVEFKTGDRCPIIELCACGGMVDFEYMKARFPQTLESPELIPHFFYLMRKETSVIAVTKEDPLIHYSAERIGKYLKKLIWRVRNNVHFPEMSAAGFSGRQEYGSFSDRMRKYLFLPYSLTVVFPAFDAAFLAMTRRNSFYFMHPVLCFYTAWAIIYHYTLKLLGLSPELKSYDGSRLVSR